MVQDVTRLVLIEHGRWQKSVISYHESYCHPRWSRLTRETALVDSMQQALPQRPTLPQPGPTPKVPQLSRKVSGDREQAFRLSLGRAFSIQAVTGGTITSEMEPLYWTMERKPPLASSCLLSHMLLGPLLCLLTP